VVDPLDWVDRFGADATRFTLARGANPGADVPVSEEWCQGSRNFCNKLWNATRFALMNGATVSGELPTDLSAVDKWILSRLQHTVTEVDQYFESFEFAKACDALYHFAWDDVCDWYVELAKPVLGAGGPRRGGASAEPPGVQSGEGTRRVLGHVLDQLLRLLHPVMPFVTDELWSALTGRDTLVSDAWPTMNPKLIDDAAEADLAALQRVVTEVRRFRSDQGLKPGQRVAATLAGLDAVGIGAHEVLIRSLVRLEPPADSFTATATLTMGGGVTVALDTRGSIDVAAERARLTKDRAIAEKEAAGCRAKLANEAFTAKAPAEVVAKIEQRLAAAEADLARIDSALAALS
jgi:valyl-tRNA synthetase